MILPELILSKRFVKNVLWNPEMIPRILSIVVDEAHVILHWGSGFRKKYGLLGILCALVPKGTPFVTMSATWTLSDRVHRDVLSKLQFKAGAYLDLMIGNDHCNVSIVVQVFHNTMNTYSELNFLIPTGVTDPKEVKQAFVYADQISTAEGMEKRLYGISPESFCMAGIIWSYSSSYSVEYQMMVMALFKAGIVHILICTDAAGMVRFHISALILQLKIMIGI